ncbi:MAG: MEDS domain-containing protein [Candidatus Eremiobacterota bacterium]
MHIKTSDQEPFHIGFGDYTCNWGVHMCGLYETEEEKEAIVFGFLRQGVLDGDMQLYCPSETIESDFKKNFTHFCSDCDSYIDDPHYFSIVSAKDLYYPDGVFSPTAMDEGLNSFYEESQKKGRRNIRATAEMVWALEAIPGVELLMVYESRLNYFIPGKPWISICLYNVNRFSGAQIMNVLRTHPFAISGGIISQNPYYIHPDRWLAENAPQFLGA